MGRHLISKPLGNDSVLGVKQGLPGDQSLVCDFLTTLLEGLRDEITLFANLSHPPSGGLPGETLKSCAVAGFLETLNSSTHLVHIRLLGIRLQRCRVCVEEDLTDFIRNAAHPLGILAVPEHSHHLRHHPLYSVVVEESLPHFVPPDQRISPVDVDVDCSSIRPLIDVKAGSDLRGRAACHRVTDLMKTEFKRRLDPDPGLVEFGFSTDLLCKEHLECCLLRLDLMFDVYDVFLKANLGCWTRLRVCKPCLQTGEFGVGFVNLAVGCVDSAPHIEQVCGKRLRKGLVLRPLLNLCDAFTDEFCRLSGVVTELYICLLTDRLDILRGKPG